MTLPAATQAKLQEITEQDAALLRRLQNARNLAEAAEHLAAVARRHGVQVAAHELQSHFDGLGSAPARSASSAAGREAAAGAGRIRHARNRPAALELAARS